MISETGKAATEYATKYGIPVFPLWPKSKNPMPKHGFLEAVTDAAQIERWWTNKPDANIGGVMGGGYVCIDFDVDENGAFNALDWLSDWEDENGKLPETATAITGRGGMHLFYRVDREIKKSENTQIHVDVRGAGSYAMLAPSVHPNGNTVYWDLHPDDYGFADADELVYKLIDEVQRKDEQEREKVIVPTDSIKEGEGRNVFLFKQGCSARAKNADDDVIRAWLVSLNQLRCSPPLDDDELEKVIASVCKHPKGLSEEAMQLKNNTLRRNDKGAVMATINNFMLILENDPALKGRFGYNEIAYTKTIETPVPWDASTGTRQISDVDYSQFAAYVERTYGLSCKAKAIDAVANVCSHHRYNPIVEWLNMLEWDGESRIRGLLPMFLGCEETDYNTAVITMFMRGAIARALNPGTKFDTMIVLVGHQGIGKSTFLMRLAHKNEWFNDNFNTIDGDTAIEKLRGMWILEMAELLATKKAQEVEAIKSFLSSRVDTIRPKYARETEQRPRMCVFAGTTNDMNFLIDPTGNRRFIPINCKATERQEILFDDSCQEFFDQCWAEVYHAYKNGETSLLLDERFLQIAETTREQHTEDDPRVGIIQEYLDAKIQNAANPENVRVCVSELLEHALKIDDYRVAPRKLINEIHSIMRNCIRGFMPYGNASNKAMTDYGVQRCYVIDEQSTYFDELRQK